VPLWRIEKQALLRRQPFGDRFQTRIEIFSFFSSAGGAMDKFDRIYQLHHILSNHRYAVSADTLCDRMECSPATLKRLIACMRDLFGAPIVNRRGYGYFYDRNISFELLGLWFNAQELHALLSMRKLLDHLEPGVLKENISPIRNRLVETKEGDKRQPAWSRVCMRETYSQVSFDTCRCHRHHLFRPGFSRRLSLFMRQIRSIGDK